MTMGPMVELGDLLSEKSRAAGARLVVNDRADVARMVGASGVHVGQTDLTVGQVRAIIAGDQFIGVSTHNQSQVAAAIRDNADYLAMGPVYTTGSKANPDPVVGLEGVARAAAEARTSGRPLVAIGGITLTTAPAVIASGADSVAVISDLLDGDSRARARAFVRALD